MGIDNDAIDRAMDAAEAKLGAMDEIEPKGSTEADLEQPIDKPVQLDLATEKALLDKANEGKKKPATPAKDDKGKFTKVKHFEAAKTAKAPKAVAPAVEEEQISDDQVVDVEPNEAAAEETPAVAPVNAPTFWSAEEKALFSKAPAQLQQIIAAKDLAYQQHVSRVTNEASRGKDMEKRIYADLETPEAIERHRNELALNGIKDPIDELHRYRAWDRLLKSDVKAGLSDLMRKNGLSPYDFMDESGQYQEVDPRVDQAARDAAEAKQALADMRAENTAREENAFRMEVESFTNGVDSNNQPRRAFAKMYAPQIAQTAGIIEKQWPSLSRQEILHHAYEYTMAEIRKSFGVSNVVQAPATPKQPEQVIAAAKKAQAAASSVTGAPSTTITAKKALKGDTFNQKLESAMDNAEEAMGIR
jgi:hypothetical protein